MSALSLAECQDHLSAHEGTARRPLALRFSASCTPAQSTVVLYRRGRISSGSPENCGEHLAAYIGNSRRQPALPLSASCTPAPSTIVLHLRGWPTSGIPSNSGST